MSTTLKLKSIALAIACSTAVTCTAQETLSLRYDTAREQVVAKQNGHSLDLPRQDSQVESSCLYRDGIGNAYVFLVGEEGNGSQWLVGDKAGLLKTPLHVRFIALPPTGTLCAVDGDKLFVNEEGVGLWEYAADADAETSRRPVILEKPFGALASIGAFTVWNGRVIVQDSESEDVHVFERDGKRWNEIALHAIPALNGQDVDELSVVAATNSQLTLRAIIDEGNREFTMPWTAAKAPVPNNVKTIYVTPTAQTEPVNRAGDAADDPAIWVNSRKPGESRILGTDKQGGLQVFDLWGTRLQDLRVGRLNNVDVRSNFRHGEETIAIAVASNRDNESLHLFRIDPNDGEVSVIGEAPTKHKDIYGLCMGRLKDGRVFVIANQKDGTFVQYQLQSNGNAVDARKIREFRVASQPEGCVVNDRTGDLFIGEESKGVYQFPLDPAKPATLSNVIAVGDVLKKDVEGMGIYNGSKRDYLVVSSQGNDSYVILDAKAPFRVRGIVRVMADGRSAIDGASETDGLEVSSANLGGAYGKGILIVQDGRKRMPEAPQNYKYVPWESIAEGLQLD